MNATSPTKRRAALATLDANAMTTSTTPTSSSKHAADADALPLKPLSSKRRSTGLLSSAPVLAPPVSVLASSTGGAPSVGMKRRSGIVLQDPATTTTSQGRQAEEEQQQQVAKKSKLEHHHHQQQAEQTPASTQSSRTHSPDASSVFDVEGAEDATWLTTATELDVCVMPVAARPPPRVVLTREQAREKVEILRLRLGLASYKLRTGQVEVSLADLQARPLPAAAATTTTAPASTVENTPDNSQGDVQQQQQQQQDDEEEEDVVEATPPPTTADDLAR